MLAYHPKLRLSRVWYQTGMIIRMIISGVNFTPGIRVWNRSWNFKLFCDRTREMKAIDLEFDSHDDMSPFTFCFLLFFSYKISKLYKKVQNFFSRPKWNYFNNLGIQNNVWFEKKTKINYFGELKSSKIHTTNPHFKHTWSGKFHEI